MMMKMKRLKNDAGTRAWNALVEEHCRLAAVRRGFFSAVAREMARRGIKVVPQQVRPWLVLDREQRVEPRAGVAKVLLDACCAVRERQN